MSLAFSLNTATFRCPSASSSSSCQIERNFFSKAESPVLTFQRRFSSRSGLAFARRRNHNAEVAASPSSKWTKKRSSARDNRGKNDEDMVDDPFEALFSLLEEDLKKDNASIGDDDDDEINEEDIDALARELEEVLGGDGDAELLHSDGERDDDDDDEALGASSYHDDDYDTEEDDEKPLKLKNWQLRRLAYDLKAGRRKIGIKDLAAELCLDRAVVLELLRNPPPNLVMLSATLPDNPSPAVVFPEKRPPEQNPAEPAVDPVETDANVSEKEPVHVKQHKWSAQKRLKKVHLETLNKVYGRSKRPTNAMINSIVQITNLPRKRVVKWFEDKRAADGIPIQHAPYRRP